MTTSNDSKEMAKPGNEHHEKSTAIVNDKQIQRNDHPSSEVIIKAINYPPGYPDDESKEKCNKKEEKHKNCHPIHCHHMQPMQSATTTITTSTDNPDHTIK
jgi:hypothetical protein